MFEDWMRRLVFTITVLFFYTLGDGSTSYSTLLIGALAKGSFPSVRRIFSANSDWWGSQGSDLLRGVYAHKIFADS